MTNFKLYPFQTATLAITPAAIAPPIYKLTVSGTTVSLGGDIKLVRSPTLSAGYIVFDVVGQTTPAIGSVAYSVFSTVQAEAGTKGVVVKGANGKKETLDWPMAEVRDTLDEHTAQAADLTSLAQLNSARAIPNAILINPTILEVVGQAPGFNYRLFLAPADKATQDGEYWPYLLSQTKIGPDWPKNGGIGPVIPPKTLHTDISRVGTKGILVVGSNKSIALPVMLRTSRP